MRIRTATTVVIATALLLAGLPGTPRAVALSPSEIRSQISSLRKHLNELSADLNRAERELTVAHRTIARHQRSLRIAGQRKDDLSISLGRRASDLYIYGAMGGMDAAVSAADLTDYIDRITYLEQLQGGEAGMLEQIRALQHRATAETAVLRSEREKASKLTRRLSERQRAMSTKLSELTRLNNFLTSVGRGAGRASRGSARGIVCPVVGSHYVVNNFGDPRPGGPHQGNDIRADTGQGVRAVLPGTIVETPFGSWWGIGIVLRDLAGNEWWYAHLSAEYVSVGERVSQGEAIGRVGCTGTCYGPHLHFEYHPGGGNAVDPYRTLSSAC